MALFVSVLSAMALSSLPGASSARTSAAPGASSVTIDPSAAGVPYDGHGGLSAGASSRLLYDYVEPQRTEILDYLYTPKFGANLHVCKVEIGGDTQSTDGTEPSHMHTRDDLNCTRGYEFWLMKEALKRNPKVKTYGLPWGEPGWINDQKGYYGDDTVTYQVNWLKCARDHHGIDVDWLGLWNERPWGTVAYVKQLRAAMDKDGFKSTQLVLGDGGMPKPVITPPNTEDKAFMAAYGAIGIHYPCEASHLGGVASSTVLAAGKKLWASEDWWSEAEWGGAGCWAKLLNENFVRMNMTSTISWSTIWSVYPGVDTFEGSGDHLSGDGYWGPGLMYAWQPWSGHYAVPPTVWASAHTTQFSDPGWKMIFSGAGTLAKGGSFVSHVSPDSKDFSLVIETAPAKCNHCSYTRADSATVAQPLAVTLSGALASHTSLSMFTTTENRTFEGPTELLVTGGQFTVHVPPASIVTVSSTKGQKKGGFPSSPIPPSAPFPPSHADPFEGEAESMGKYWADQCGSFQQMPVLGGARALGAGAAVSKMALRQRAQQRPGVNKWGTNLANPLTVAGDENSTDYTVEADVRPDQDPTAAERAATASALKPWVYSAGQINGGGGAHAFPFPSLSAAQAACSAGKPIKGCVAITFQGADKAPTKPFQAWLTTRDSIDKKNNGWHSYTHGKPEPSPPPAPPLPDMGVWAGVCGRVSRCPGGSKIFAVCLQTNKTHWRVVDSGHSMIMGSGAATPGAGGWLKLSLTFKGAAVTASVDGKAVGGAMTTTEAAGMAGLESWWGLAEYDNFGMHP